MKDIIVELFNNLLTNNWQNPIAIVTVITRTIFLWFSSGISVYLNDLNFYLLAIIVLFEYLFWDLSTKIKKIRRAILESR